MLVLIGLCRELNELRLLLLGECVSLWLFPSMALFYICHYAVRRVAADISVTNRRSEYRMQNGIYDFHTVRLEPSIVDQGNIELLYITILDCSDVLFAKVRANIIVVHINVVGSRRLFQFFLEFDVLIPKGIECHLAGLINKKVVLQVLLDLLLHITKRSPALLSFRNFVGCYEFPTIYGMTLTVTVRILIFILTVRTLRFACSQNPAFIISSFFCHNSLPPISH